MADTWCLKILNINQKVYLCEVPGEKNSITLFPSSTLENVAKAQLPPFCFWIPFGQKLSLAKIRDLIPILSWVYHNILIKSLILLRDNFWPKGVQEQNGRSRAFCRVFYGYSWMNFFEKCDTEWQRITKKCSSFFVWMQCLMFHFHFFLCHNILW